MRIIFTTNAILIILDEWVEIVKLNYITYHIKLNIKNVCSLAEDYFPPLPDYLIL